MEVVVPTLEYLNELRKRGQGENAFESLELSLIYPKTPRLVQMMKI
jgi:hypothetical protein